MLDYHLHLWEHGPRPLEATLEQVAAYCERAAVAGVTEIALTEHLHRFHQASDLLGRWWEREDADPRLVESMAKATDPEVGADLDRYVEVGLAAKAEGLPVVLGLEVDFHAGRMDVVRGLLDGYPFDVLLGSVHWIGAWGLDNLADAAVAAEWEVRPIEDIWEAYTRSIEELAASGTCDVLAHPDLCKVTGRRPAVPDEWYDRMAEAAAGSGMAAELNTNGLRKPVGEVYPAPDLLARFAAAGVPFTTASDAHRADRVAERRAELRALLDGVGRTWLQAYRARHPHPVDVAPAPAVA